MRFSDRSVCTAPGQTVLTVILYWARSAAAAFVKADTAARALAERTIVADGSLAMVEVILMMRPQLFFFMKGTTAFENLTTLKKFCCRVSNQRVSVTSKKEPGGGPPALLMRMSSRPMFSTAF